MKLPVRSERGWVQAWVVIKENKTQLDSAGYDRKQMADKLDGERQQRSSYLSSKPNVMFRHSQL